MLLYMVCGDMGREGSMISTFWLRQLFTANYSLRN